MKKGRGVVTAYRNAADEWVDVEGCSRCSCEELPVVAEVRISVTDLDGNVLDIQRLCKPCTRKLGLEPGK